MVYNKRLHVESAELATVRAIYEDSFPIDERYRSDEAFVIAGAFLMLGLFLLLVILLT